MWAALAQVAGQAISLYQAKKAQDEQVAIYRSRLKETKQLAAEQLALTYNSILQKSLETQHLMNREMAAMAAQKRAAEGQIAAAAAQTGATGRRAKLAQKQSVDQPYGRQVANLRQDAKREQDALIRRAEMEERQMINRLIEDQGAIDIPDDNSGEISSGVMDMFSTAGAGYLDYKGKQSELNELTVDPFPGKAGR